VSGLKIDRIRAGISAKTETRWPGTDEPIWIHVLDKAALQEAAFAADKRFHAAGVDVAAHTIEAYKDEETVQILWRAIVDEAGKPITPSVEGFRVLLTTDVQTRLAQDYAAFEAETSPSLERMSDEDFEAFLVDLKKKPEAMIGCVSNIAFARKLLRSLADQPQN